MSMKTRNLLDPQTTEIENIIKIEPAGIQNLCSAHKHVGFAPVSHSNELAPISPHIGSISQWPDEEKWHRQSESSDCNFELVPIGMETANAKVNCLRSHDE